MFITNTFWLISKKLQRQAYTYEQLHSMSVYKHMSMPHNHKCVSNAMLLLHMTIALVIQAQQAQLTIH
jgi:hypothetical protein